MLSSLITDDAHDAQSALVKFLDEAEQVQKTFKKCSSDGVAMQSLSYDTAQLQEAVKRGTTTHNHLKKLIASCLLLHVT